MITSMQRYLHISHPRYPVMTVYPLGSDNGKGKQQENEKATSLQALLGFPHPAALSSDPIASPIHTLLHGWVSGNVY